MKAVHQHGTAWPSSCGVDLTRTQPAPDNKNAAASPPLEEKALGAMAKAGTRPLVGVLSYGEAPTRKGLHFMDAPAAAVENLTALRRGGCQLICFGTGVGNPIGNMVAPTVKVCGNVNTLNTWRDNIDFDVSAILENSVPRSPIWATGSTTTRPRSPRAPATPSEVLDVRETAISRFERSL